MMKQKLMAVVVAGALAAPAMVLADTAIYGSFNAEYGKVTMPDRAAAGTSFNNWDGMNSGASYLGFKGEEKLDGGMAAFYQCESDVRFLAGPATPATLCARNSAVGLKGAFGAVSIGTWDSPQKIAVGKTRITADTGWLGVTHLLLRESNRNSNSINYSLPDFGGISIGLQTTTTNAASDTTTPGNTGRRNGANAVYAQGPLILAVALTSESDNAAGGVAGDKDTSTSLGAAYTFGPVKVGFTYVTDKQHRAASDTERRSWNLAGTYNLPGPHSLWAGYTVAGDKKVSTGAGANTGGTEYQLGYANQLSKRTLLALGYGSVKNGSAGTNYKIGDTAATGLAAGSSSSVLTLQLKHNF
ncbi:MAG: porin [Betaproteobacteria bacterium]|nr:porin [Betaproteobacteria bacterium]